MIGVESRNGENSIRVINKNRLPHLNTHKQRITKLQKHKQMNKPRNKKREKKENQRGTSKKLNKIDNHRDMPGVGIVEEGFW